MFLSGRGNSPSYGCSSMICHPGNALSRSSRLAPGGNGPLRARVQTRKSRVASAEAMASTSRPIDSRCGSFKWLKHSTSRKNEKPEPTPESRNAVTSPSKKAASTLAACARRRAARIALGTTSTPTTCQPRRASSTDHLPVPHPRSSAGPRQLTPRLFGGKECADLWSHRRRFRLPLPRGEANLVHKAVPAAHCTPSVTSGECQRRVTKSKVHSGTLAQGSATSPLDSSRGQRAGDSRRKRGDRRRCSRRRAVDDAHEDARRRGDDRADRRARVRRAARSCASRFRRARTRMRCRGSSGSRRSRSSRTSTSTRASRCARSRAASRPCGSTRATSAARTRSRRSCSRRSRPASRCGSAPTRARSRSTSPTSRSATRRRRSSRRRSRRCGCSRASTSTSSRSRSSRATCRR